jgi:hypothetical protein
VRHQRRAKLQLVTALFCAMVARDASLMMRQHDRVWIIVQREIGIQKNAHVVSSAGVVLN